MNALCEITFEFFYDRENREEILCLIWNIPELGSPGNSKHLFLETSDDQYPIWVNKEPIRVAQGREDNKINKFLKKEVD